LGETISSTPLLGPIAGAMMQAVHNARQVLDLGDLARLNQELQRQELSLRMAELQARVAQELAIAQRIEGAEEVEIEEYYENGGEGSIGFSPGTNSVGASARGRRVTKRVFRFLGTRGGEAPSTTTEAA
jgi:hypothetical protein